MYEKNSQKRINSAKNEEKKRNVILFDHLIQHLSDFLNLG